jgi:hypothetical protein
MGDLVEYKRPLIVLLLFSVLIFVFTNYGTDIFKYENFVDAPYTCSVGVSDRKGCIEAGGFWKQDGNMPAGCDAACNCCVPNASFPTSMQYPAANCESSSATYTLTDTTTIYSESMLPTNTPARTADGALTADSLKTHLDNLIKANKLATAPATSADPQAIYMYLQTDETAIKSLQKEYCYYSVRYAYTIKKILEVASATGSAATEGADWLAAARTLNGRLIDLITIMKYLTTLRLAYGADTSATERNASLTIRMKALSDQSNDLSGPNANTELYKKMVEYTKQKGKANGNLVLLYTFMNLIALGMLFYIYTST